jgi:hypothetical protein
VAIETRCSICGQGFQLYWERQTATEQADTVSELQAAFKAHHLAGNGTDAHPEHGFLVPAWDGPIAFSGAAILGNAPASAF